MPIQIPQLDTSGIDVTNTMAKIASMKHMDAADENMRSEMASRDSQNAMRVLQAKRDQDKDARQQEKEDAELRKSNMDEVTQGLRWTQANPDQRSAYTQYYNYMKDLYDQSGGKRGVHPAFLVEPNDFVVKKGDTETWDSSKFNSYAEGGLRATKMLQDPAEGKTFTSPPFKNPHWDPKTPESPKYMKQEFVIKDGKQVPVGEPMPDESLGFKDEELKIKRAQESRESTKDKTGTWDYIGTSEDGKKIIQQNKKSGEVRLADVPGNTPIQAKPKPGKGDDAIDKLAALAGIKKSDTKPAPVKPAAGLSIKDNVEESVSKGTPVKTKSGRPAVKMPDGKIYYTDGK